MPCKSLSVCLLLFIQILFSHTCFGEVYKWIDENGRVVYGDKPKSDNANKVEIKKAPELDKNNQTRLEKQQKLLKIMQDERNEKIALEKEAKEKKKQQEKQCKKLKKELQEMKDASFLYKKTDDPKNPIIYSDEERKTEEEKLTKYIKKNC